jgi:hypothetical protein
MSCGVPFSDAAIDCDATAYTFVCLKTAIEIVCNTINASDFV